MSSHSLTNPPILPYLGDKKPVMTERGWCHPDNGEVLTTIRDGATKAAGADVIAVRFGATSYERGDDLSVVLVYNEKVNVTAGSTLVVTATGGSNITLKAAAQTGVQEVVYNKQNGDGTTQEVVPDRADTYSIGAQTPGGTVVDALGGVAASGTLTFAAIPTADDTVVIDGKTYTFKSTLTNTNGFVKIGTSILESIENLVAAINLEDGAGTRYAAATTLHSTVSAKKVDSTMVVTAKTKGTAGNSLGTTETLTHESSIWGASTLAGGTATASSNKAISSGVALACGTRVVASGVIDTAEWVDDTLSQGDAIGVSVHFDQTVDVTAGASLVVTSTTGNITLYAAAQSNVNDVVFDKKVNNSTPEVVPSNVAATGTIVNDGTNVTNGDTVTINGKVYTFQDTLTNVDGNVKIGASNTASMTNLKNAINASGGTPGTDYAAATTAHPTVTAGVVTVTVTVTAITAGTGGNALTLAENSTHLTVSGATLSGGVTKAPTTLSVAAQTITGTIVDHGTTSVAASKAISSAVAATLAPISVS